MVFPTFQASNLLQCVLLLLPIYSHGFIYSQNAGWWCFGFPFSFLQCSHLSGIKKNLPKPHTGELIKKIFNYRPFALCLLPLRVRMLLRQTEIWPTCVCLLYYVVLIYANQNALSYYGAGSLTDFLQRECNDLVKKESNFESK